MTDENRTNSIDLANPNDVRIGVTRGTNELAIRRPRDYPDQVDVSIGSTADDRISFSVDAAVGDHGTGHADLELTVGEARSLRDLLDEAARRVADE